MLIHPEHGGTPREAGLAVEVETGGGLPAAEATPVARRAENGSRMPLLRLLAFATPTIPLAAMAMPVTTYLPNYYAQDLKVDLGELAWAFMVVRFFDLWFDPALGLIMDRTKSPWGRFRPWFVAGAPIAMLATYMLFMAEPGIGGLYILLWLIVGFSGQSMGQLGHMAWAATVAPGYDERSRVYGWWQAMTVIGMIAILLMPPIVKYVFGGEFATGVKAMGWFTIIFLPLTAILALMATGEPAAKPHHETPKLSHVLAMFRRGSVLRVLAADICWGTALAVSGTLLFFYFDAVRDIERGMAGLMLIVFFVGGLAGAPIWRTVARRFGKHRALAFAGIAWAAMQFSVLVSPNILWVGFLTMFLAGLPYASGPIMLKAMMADVADEERLASGVDRTGLLFSLLTGSVKIGSMLAVGGSLFALKEVGFIAELSGENTAEALLTLQLMFCLGPAVLALTAAWLISGYRLDAVAHDEVRRRLAEKDLEHQPPLVP
jgi:Na+/melibiose symporter-like transporter